MSRPTLLPTLPHVYSPFGLDFARDDALASPFEHARVGGGVEVAQLPYRHSLLPSHAAPLQAADIPANHHPAIANANANANGHAHAHAHAQAFVNQRSSAVVHHAVAASRLAANATASAAATTYPLQLSAATLRELQRRDLAKRKHFRDFQERDLRERARARKLTRAAVRASRQYNMESTAAEFGMSEEEYTEMQKLSNEYQPDVSGPEVSERISTDAIAAEYARADPSFQVKTASIPQNFPLYRRCKGDGHCGWRAIAFCYYETLLYMGSKQKYREEETRIRSLSNLLQAVGVDRTIFEAWEEEVLDLLTALANSNSSKEGEAILLANFNDGPQATWQSIITYLKTLTSSWIKTRREDYEPFMQGMTANEYCAIHIDPYQAEIEHVGLSALADALLKPTGFAMEVHYLDRSAGAEAFIHRFDPADNTGVTIPGTPVIRLLYRPGHYDILYAFTDAPMLAHPPHPATNGVQRVYLASPSDDSPQGLHSTPSSYTLGAEGLTPLMNIPGMSGISTPTLDGSPGLWMGPPPMASSHYSAVPTYDYPPRSTKVDYVHPIQPQPVPSTAHPVPVAPQLQRIASTEATYAHNASMPPSSAYVMAAPPTYIEATPSVYHHSHSHSHSAASAPPVHHGGIDRNGSTYSSPSSIFRPSKFEYESRWSEATLGGPNVHGRDLGFQTSIFRNSHYNIAHFNNPEFEPEQWQPGQESCEKGRRKSVAQ